MQPLPVTQQLHEVNSLMRAKSEEKPHMHFRGYTEKCMRLGLKFLGHFLTSLHFAMRGGLEDVSARNDDQLDAMLVNNIWVSKSQNAPFHSPILTFSTGKMQ